MANDVLCKNVFRWALATILAGLLAWYSWPLLYALDYNLGLLDRGYAERRSVVPFTWWLIQHVNHSNMLFRGVSKLILLPWCISLS